MKGDYMLYIFICIGTTKIVGDSLGPITGTFLKEKYMNNERIKVFGDINKQIDFYNADRVFCEIEKKYNKDCIKIIIDSALGNKIGHFEVSQGDIYLGKGLNKNKVINGDINIIGTVGRDYGDMMRNLAELKSLKIKYINQMAKEIVRAIDFA